MKLGGMILSANSMSQLEFPVKARPWGCRTEEDRSCFFNTVAVLPRLVVSKCQQAAWLPLLWLPSIPNRRWGMSSDGFGKSYHCFGGGVFAE